MSGDHAHAKVFPTEWPNEVYYGGASAGKLGMWVFLLSDALTFAGFLLAYGILRGSVAEGSTWIPEGAPALGIEFTAALTFLLICSSVTMVLAYAAAVEKDQKKLVRYLALTAFGGFLFLCGQYKEYFGMQMLGHAIGGDLGHWFEHGLVPEGLIFGDSHYATTFYVVTAFHGAHVTTGVIYLLVITYKAAKGHYNDGNYDQVEICGLFWHFVDLIWILVFTFIYLIPEA